MILINKKTGEINIIKKEKSLIFKSKNKDKKKCIIKTNIKGE